MGTPGKRPWSEFRTEILAAYEPPLRRRRTYWKVREVLGLIERVGIESPVELTIPFVARCVKQLESDGVAENTAAGKIGYIRAICAFAEASGDIAQSPFRFRGNWMSAWPVPIEGALLGTDQHHSIQDIARVLDALRVDAEGGGWIEGRLYALTATVAFCGLRSAEAIGLRLQDVDVAARMVRLRKTHRRGLKTIHSEQPVPMPPPLLSIVAAWSLRIRSEGCPWLFPGVKRIGPWSGGPYGRRAVDCLITAARRAGVEGVTFASLRHSWATHAESRWGLSDPQIQRVMRHSTPLTSRRHYRHADEENLRVCVERVAFAVA